MSVLYMLSMVYVIVNRVFMCLAKLSVKALSNLVEEDKGGQCDCYYWSSRIYTYWDLLAVSKALFGAC